MEDDQLFAICNREQTLADADLQSRRRASLILAIIDGRTHAEISKYLGIPVGTVKAWVRRELIALRERLK